MRNYCFVVIVSAAPSCLYIEYGGGVVNQNEFMTKKSWWGEFDFAQDEIKCWRIAQRTIAVRRSAQEWTIWNKDVPTEINKPVVVSKPKARESFDGVHFERFVVEATKEQLFVEPSLADRAMVVRPNKPITVMPGAKVRLYVSTPIWVTLSLLGDDTPITDIPFWRPSDSWFGASTMSGDMCYSKYTDAKLDPADLEIRSHRASTQVTVINDQKENLLIQRLNIPVPLLKVYVNAAQEFWTDQVTILQQTEHLKPVSTVLHQPPDDLQAMTLVSESRELSNKPSFISSIKNLIG